MRHCAKSGKANALLHLVKTKRNVRYVPDENFFALWKALSECPTTWQELEKKSVKIQAARDRLN